MSHYIIFISNHMIHIKHLYAQSGKYFHQTPLYNSLVYWCKIKFPMNVNFISNSQVLWRCSFKKILGRFDIYLNTKHNLPIQYHSNLSCKHNYCYFTMEVYRGLDRINIHKNYFSKFNIDMNILYSPGTQQNQSIRPNTDIHYFHSIWTCLFPSIINNYLKI